MSSVNAILGGMNIDASEAVVSAHSTCASISSDLLPRAIDEAKNDGFTLRVIRAAAPGNGSPLGHVHQFHSAVAEFRHQALAAAGNVGEPWVTVVRELVTDLAAKHETLAALMREPPHTDEHDDIERWTRSMWAAAAPLKAILSTYCNETTTGMHDAIEVHKQQQMKLAKKDAKKDLVVPAGQTDSVVNVLLNVLNVYQFNVQIIHARFNEAVEREAVKAPEAERAEFKALALELRDAIAAGEQERIKTAMAAVQEWVAANPGDRGLAVAGFLIGLIGLILGIAAFC
jgi:hypothetical protein